MRDSEDDLFAEFAAATQPIEHTERIQRVARRVRRIPVSRRSTANMVPSPAVTSDDTAPLRSPSPWRLVRTGMSRERLRRLGRGRADYLLDLHGSSRAEAVQRLQQMIATAMQSGGRVVEIIHGRGLHSSGGVAVLRQAIYEWLEHGPCSSLVLAVIPRPDSGGGASLLLLRRVR
ncbi:MAG: Smr/MutS family protein [Mariprofundales bacterium]|nr:Smr/MutS family protein [Mariprofundales bacterium]